MTTLPQPPPPSPPDLNIPPSTHKVSIIPINTTSTIHGAKTSDFFGPPIKGHEWLAARVFTFLIQHHEYDVNTNLPIPGKTRNLLFDLGIRKDWWNSAPKLVNILRSIRPPWTLTTERSVADILVHGEGEGSLPEDHAVEEQLTHTCTTQSGPETRESSSARDVRAELGTIIAEYGTGIENNNNNTTTTTTKTGTSASTTRSKLEPDAGKNDNSKTIKPPQSSTARRDTYRDNIDLETIEGIIWSHHHFDHTGDPSLFPSESTALIVGPGVGGLLFPGYPEDGESTLLGSDYEGREVIELDFGTDTETGNTVTDSTVTGGGSKSGNRGKRFNTLRIGQLAAIDYFGDGSFYLLDTPGHAVGHICALARVTCSSSSSSFSCPGREESDIDTFVLLAGDAFHHPGELRPSKWMRVPEKLSVSVVPEDTEESNNPVKGYRIQDSLSLRDGQLGTGSKQGTEADQRRGLDADFTDTDGCDHASKYGPVPPVGIDINVDDMKVAAADDLTGPDGTGHGRVVGDETVRLACASAPVSPVSATSTSQLGDQQMPVINIDVDMSVKKNEGRTEPDTVAGLSEFGQDQRLKSSDTATTSSLGETNGSGMATSMGEDPDMSGSRDVSTARGRRFILSGRIFTDLLPHLRYPSRGSSGDPQPHKPSASGSDGDDWFGNGSFYYPAGSPICDTLAVACQASQSQSYISTHTQSHPQSPNLKTSQRPNEYDTNKAKGLENPTTSSVPAHASGRVAERGGPERKYGIASASQAGMPGQGEKEKGAQNRRIPKSRWHHNPTQAADTLHKLQMFDAQRNILVLAAHDESLLGLPLDIQFPGGTLDDWFRRGWKDKLLWQFLGDFVGAIPVDDSPRGDNKGHETERMTLDVGWEETCKENLMLLKRRWEENKDYWGPVGCGGV